MNEAVNFWPFGKKTVIEPSGPADGRTWRHVTMRAHSASV
jgi:hypothetical protein